MSTGMSFAEANPIHDYEASTWWRNNNWMSESLQYDDWGYWYRPGYWRWVPESSGWYSVDCLNSVQNDVFGRPHIPSYIEIYESDGLGNYWHTAYAQQDQTQVEVVAGKEYWVVVTCRYNVNADYSARISAVATPGPWQTPPPSVHSNVNAMEFLSWLAEYTITQAFGGRVPGGEADAYPCCWNWARKGFNTSQYWSPDGNGTVGGDGVTGWGGAAGTCMTYSGAPDQTNTGAIVGWSFSSDAGGSFLPAKMRADVYGRTWRLNMSKVSQYTNQQLVSWSAAAIEFENGNTTPAPRQLTVTLTETVGAGAESAVMPEFPSLGAAAGWGPFLRGSSPAGLGMAGGTGGPEGHGVWTDYASGTSFIIDGDAAQSAYDATIAQGFQTGYGVGWMLHVIPKVALSSTVPADVSIGTTVQSVAHDTARNVTLDVTYQAARYRLIDPTPPTELVPRFLGGWMVGEELIG